MYSILKRLAPLATIADTTLDSKSKTNNENEDNSEFMVFFKYFVCHRVINIKMLLF